MPHREKKCQAVIGIDFGTAGARAGLFDVNSGELISEISGDYENGIITQPNNSEFKRHNPHDYLNFLKKAIPKLLKKQKISAKGGSASGGKVIGVGIDCTDCTLIAVDKKGEPLFFQKKYSHNPRSLIKLYADHTAIKQTEKINKVLAGEKILIRCGGQTSSEWWLAKVLNDFEEDKQFFTSVDKYIHIVDWLGWVLSGHFKPNTCSAGYKAHQHDDGVGINKRILKKLSDDLDVLKVVDKLNTNFYLPGSLVGSLKKEWLKHWGLDGQVKIAVGMIDAHAQAIGAAIKEEAMVAIVGTTTCEMYCHKNGVYFPGINVVRGGILPGLYGYEAGQAGTGVMYQHFAQLFKGEPIEKIQKKLIEELALSKRHTPIIVIPWWRGSRTPVADSNFTGIILGLTGQTKPIDIYQGMLEATAFATQEVIEMLAEKKMKVKKLILAGGIPLKNQAQVQAYTYTFGQEVSVTKNHGCLGPAILAAVASGYYPDIGTAQDALTNFYQPIICQPTDKKLKNIYRKKFLVYQKLSRLLATQGAATLKFLKEIQLNNY